MCKIQYQIEAILLQASILDKGYIIYAFQRQLLNKLQMSEGRGYMSGY